jgi:O-antigen ligase
MMAVIYIFIVAAVFRTRAYDDKSIDIQVATKLAAFAIMFVTTGLFFHFALARMRFPRLFYIWLTFFVALVFSALYSANVPFALTCTVLFLLTYLYTVYMAVRLSRLTAVQVMMCAALLMCIGSIFAYYAVPSVGVMQGWTPEGGFGEIGRMKGLTGSANGIGLIAAFAIVLSILYFRACGRFGQGVALLLMPSALLCLYLSNNRSSMIGVAAALWFSFAFRKNMAPKFMLSILFGIIGAGALVFFSDEIFALVSRSGNTSEITSVTGRSQIWAVVLEMWAQRPIQGYGYASALAILPLDPRLFHAAAHAHNMYLELLFGGGVILLGLFLYAVWQTYRQALRIGAISEAALLTFFMVRGLTEATPFSGMVSFSSFAVTVIFALIIAPLVSMRRRAAPLAAAAFSASGAGPGLRRSHP